MASSRLRSRRSIAGGNRGWIQSVRPGWWWDWCIFRMIVAATTIGFVGSRCKSAVMGPWGGWRWDTGRQLAIHRRHMGCGCAGWIQGRTVVGSSFEDRGWNMRWRIIFRCGPSRVHSLGEGSRYACSWSFERESGRSQRLAFMVVIHPARRERLRSILGHFEYRQQVFP